jgi:hypothetical protein
VPVATLGLRDGSGNAATNHLKRLAVISWTKEDDVNIDDHRVVLIYKDLHRVDIQIIEDSGLQFALDTSVAQRRLEIRAKVVRKRQAIDIGAALQNTAIVCGSVFGVVATSALAVASVGGAVTKVAAAACGLEDAYEHTIEVLNTMKN